jgi:glycosyltransferase involved in cell wall biosynthesis
MATGTIRVAAFTGGETVSSRRFRVQQYLPCLKQLGVEVDEYIAYFGSWPPPQKLARSFWLAATLLDRIPSVAKSHDYDVTLLQREMVSTLVTLERWTHRPRVLDLDDAVWLNRGAEKRFAALVRMCDGVICGNSFIAEHVSQMQNNLIVLPTPVDTDRFRPRANDTVPQRKLIIGWAGLSSGFKYLRAIEDALVNVLNRNKDAVVRVVSDCKPVFRQLDGSRLEYIPWSPENEVMTIQEMTVGLMPIDDSLWSRGKCSYKMLLYMACGVPVVVSPFGMNREVLALGKPGLGATDDHSWFECLSWLLDNPETARRMGVAGRTIVEEHFSLRASAPRLAAFLKGTCQCVG